ncbi:hypothetical protein EDD29_3554 [Actinocorallia herbida]|uniref:Uncharacterized protein n=1 Tax=Actinocorallia herbida TaxID=58109 RepID=A0A3N1CXI0_9ACTN|nr:hypothetical protein [Actinocorallia herbida]ROO85997.1 hypothetical protein EDD29_3554 [Actinocorallia herbida]
MLARRVAETGRIASDTVAHWTANSPDIPRRGRTLDVEDRIRAAYRLLAPAPQGFIDIRDLRAALPDLPHAAVTTTLTEMHRSPRRAAGGTHLDREFPSADFPVRSLGRLSRLSEMGSSG